MKSGLAKTFVGFGFGPIQSALFLYEAFQSGNFRRLVVLDIDRRLIEAVRDNGGRYALNIARTDRVEQAVVEGVELFDARDPAQVERFLEAVAGADEMCTALPSVDSYTAGGESSVVSLLARGLSARAGTPATGLPTILYTAENHNRAAEILGAPLLPRLPPAVAGNVQLLNTVIGKMSGVIGEAEAIERLGLAAVTPALPRAILVEEFNRILISRVRLPGYRRGIEVFVEKEELLPFEEAKLYGHNAVHALIAYLADLKGYRLMAEADRDPWIKATARRAFIEESGAALIRRHARLEDPLFSERGYSQYAEDLLERMLNPNLNDLVERVGRDPLRKLALDDRLYGTMLLALEQGIEPRHLALGAAAAVLSLIKRRKDLPRGPDTLPGGSQRLPGRLRSLPEEAAALDEAGLGRLLSEIWAESPAAGKYGEKLIRLTWQGLERLRQELG